MTWLARFLERAGWRVEEPALLAALLAAVLAAAVAGAVGIVRRRALLGRSYGALAPRVAPGATASRPAAKLAIACAGLALVAVAAARPRSGRDAQRPAGLDLAIVLDASRSMLARDAAPDRLTRARAGVADLLERLPGVRVAVVAFAGNAAVAVPLTPDLAAARLLLASVDPAAMPLQGTDLPRALAAAERALAPAAERGAARAALLVSDGEDHREHGAAEAAERLALAGVPLFTAGVGSPEGAPIPQAGGGTLLDASGRRVLSRLDEERLTELAGRGGGRYVRLDDADGVEELARALSRLERAPTRPAPFRTWEDRFELFAVPGLLLLAAGAALPRGSRRGPRSRTGRAVVRGGAAAGAALLAGAAPFLAEHERLAEANALAATDPEAALRLIDAVERELGPRGEIDVNRGLALFRAGRVDEARRSFSLAVRAPGPLASRGAYADGVAALAQGDEDAAVTAWRRALVLDPTNGAARFNLEVLLRRRAEGQAAAPRPGDSDRDPEGAEGEAGERVDGVATGAPGRPGEASAPRAAEEHAGQEDPAAPLSRAEAERLLDAVAAGERVMPARPTTGREAPPRKAW